MDKIKEQKGFIYPFTLIACFLVVSLTFIQVNVYLSEKQFLYEKERLIMLESLIQVSVQQFRKGDLDIMSNEQLVLVYDEGTVTFKIADVQDGISYVTVDATLTTGHQRRASFTINWELRSIEYYLEVSEL